MSLKKMIYMPVVAEVNCTWKWYSLVVLGKDII